MVLPLRSASSALIRNDPYITNIQLSTGVTGRGLSVARGCSGLNYSFDIYIRGRRWNGGRRIRSRRQGNVGLRLQGTPFNVDIRSWVNQTYCGIVSWWK